MRHPYQEYHCRRTTGFIFHYRFNVHRYLLVFDFNALIFCRVIFGLWRYLLKNGQDDSACESINNWCYIFFNMCLVSWFNILRVCAFFAAFLQNLQWCDWPLYKFYKQYLEICKAEFWKPKFLNKFYVTYWTKTTEVQRNTILEIRHSIERNWNFYRSSWCYSPCSTEYVILFIEVNLKYNFLRNIFIIYVLGAECYYSWSTISFIIGR